MSRFCAADGAAERRRTCAGTTLREHAALAGTEQQRRAERNY
ncbi:hypothetical protein [Microbacterium sp. GCS4]|nr:hypothetical protein [Microbacterium sp. GCS4]